MIVLDFLINLFLWVMFHHMVNSTDITAFGLAAFLFVSPYSYELFKMGVIEDCISYKEGTIKDNGWYWCLFCVMVIYWCAALFMVMLKMDISVQIMRYTLIPILIGYCLIGCYYNKNGRLT